MKQRKSLEIAADILNCPLAPERDGVNDPQESFGAMLSDLAIDDGLGGPLPAKNEHTKNMWALYENREHIATLRTVLTKIAASETITPKQALVFEKVPELMNLLIAETEAAVVDFNREVTDTQLKLREQRIESQKDDIREAKEIAIENMESNRFAESALRSKILPLFEELKTALAREKGQEPRR